MRALILSDLHQGEGGVDYDPAKIKAPFDLVIVAGDAAGRLTHALVWLYDRFGGGFEFLDGELELIPTRQIPTAPHNRPL